MKIGILGAMPEEISSIKNLMLCKNEKTIGKRTYYEGIINDIEVVLTFSRWGKVASSSTTTTLINQFNVDFIFFTGVAGAIDKKLNIGDIVVGNGFYQHDMDARPLFNQFQIPLTDSILFEPKKQYVTSALNASKNFIKEISQFIDNDTLNNFSISNPMIYEGIIASGDKFVTDSSKMEMLIYTSDKNKTLAVEMEGASVAQICYEHEIPYIIIRTISDKADHSAHIDFQSFIQNIACKYSSEILNEFIKNINTN